MIFFRDIKSFCQVAANVAHVYKLLTNTAAKLSRKVLIVFISDSQLNVDSKTEYLSYCIF